MVKRKWWKMNMFMERIERNEGIMYEGIGRRGDMKGVGRVC